MALIRALSGSSGGGSAKCVLTVSNGNSNICDTDYVTYSSNVTTFAKACKGYFYYSRAATVTGTATLTSIQASSNYGVGLYEFEASAGQTITYGADGGAAYGYGIIVV